MLRPVTFFLLLLLLHGRTANPLPNVALLGTASQSSIMLSGHASNAIDGNKNPDYLAGSCTHTQNGPSHWWSLLLPAVYRIASVSVTNRVLVPHRISNSEILIGNSPENNGNNNPRCAVITSIPSASTRTFDCGGMIGRFVNVKLDSDQNVVLTICELEVYGEPAAPSPSFSAVVMGRSVAVVERKLCWSDALFYCRDFYWDLLSIRSEEEQREVEEVLRNASFPLPEHVWVGLRRYLMGPRWFWMSGASVNYSNWATESVWQVTSPCGGIDTSNRFHWRDLPCGHHLYFICLKDIQRDIERVEFFSSNRP